MSAFVLMNRLVLAVSILLLEYFMATSSLSFSSGLHHKPYFSSSMHVNKLLIFPHQLSIKNKELHALSLILCPSLIFCSVNMLTL